MVQLRFRQTGEGRKSYTTEATQKWFSNLMFMGKCKAALDLFSREEKGGIHLDDSVNPDDPNFTYCQRITDQQAYHRYNSCIISNEPQEPHP